MGEPPRSHKPDPRMALRVLRIENARLRQQVIELRLEIEALREIANTPSPRVED